MSCCNVGNWEYFSSNRSSRHAICSSVHVACGPSGAPREKLKDLLTEVDDMSKVWPHTLMQGDMDNEAEYTIVVDGHFALKAKTLTRAVKLLFVSYYVFNICNPIELVNTLTFLQQAILNQDGGNGPIRSCPFLLRLPCRGDMTYSLLQECYNAQFAIVGNWELVSRTVLLLMGNTVRVRVT